MRPNSFLGFHLAEVPAKIGRRLRSPSEAQVTNPPYPLVQIGMAPYGGFWFHKGWVERIGLPDDRLYVGLDDYEYTGRVVAKGGRIYLCAASEVVDLETSWHHKPVSSKLWVAPDVDKTRLYLTVRNAAFLESRLVSRRWLYLLNREFYLLFLALVGLVTDRAPDTLIARLALIRKAIGDGDSGRLGPPDRESREPALPDHGSGHRGAAPEAVTVAYIGGFGRSGSTLLERLLGQVPAVCAVGELRHIWERGFLGNQLCGCGAQFNSCEFWNSVVEEAFDSRRNLDPVHVLQVQREVDRFRCIPAIEGSRRRAPGFEQALDAYTGVLHRILSGIRQVSGASIIVDSSKDPPHGFLLRAVSGMDLRVVHLVRDSRAVAYSWRRLRERPEIYWKHENMPQYTSLKCAALWDLANVLIERLGRSCGHYSRITYEELIARPRETVEELFRSLEVEVPSLRFLTETSADLKVNHTVSGNPMRFQTGRVLLQNDDEWRSKLPWIHQLIVAALTRPLMRRYGFIAE
jgi:hypothetical protein